MKNNKLGIALLSATILGGLTLGTQSGVYADEVDTTAPITSTTVSSEVANTDITTPLTEADYEAVAETVWGSWYFKDVPTDLSVPTIDTEPFRALDIDHTNKIDKWSLPKLVDAYNTNRVETYNDTDILEIWKKRYKYKEVDGQFADFNVSTIEDGNTYYFKEDKLFVTKNMGGRDGKYIAISPKEQWTINKDNIKVPFYLPSGPGDVDRSYPLTATVKLNHKEYAGGISRSKFYLSDVVDTRKIDTTQPTKPAEVETSTKILAKELTGYSYEQILAAQVWYTLTDGNYSYTLHRREAGEMIYGYGDSKRFPDVTYVLFESGSGRDYASIYMVDYKDNGDGTVTVYNMPKHWHIDDSEIDSFTQNILDTAKVVELKKASKADILRLLKMGDFSNITTGAGSNSGISGNSSIGNTNTTIPSNTGNGGNTTTKPTDANATDGNSTGTTNGNSNSGKTDQTVCVKDGDKKTTTVADGNLEDKSVVAESDSNTKQVTASNNLTATPKTPSRVESRHLPKAGDSRSFIATLLGLTTLTSGLVIGRKYKR